MNKIMGVFWSGSSLPAPQRSSGVALAFALAAMAALFSSAARSPSAAAPPAAAAAAGGGGGGGGGGAFWPEQGKDPYDPHALLAAAAAEHDDAERRLPPEARVRYMREMQDVVEALERDVARPSTAGQVREASQRVRAFCRHAYRALGKDPALEVSDGDARTALDDAALLQARALNAISSLHMVTHRERRRSALDAAMRRFAASSDAHIAELRRVLVARQSGRRRGRGPLAAYEPGQGFPSPWGGPDAEGHSGFGAGAEARYRVATE
jgi:hypothetical protein